MLTEFGGIAFQRRPSRASSRPGATPAPRPTRSSRSMYDDAAATRDPHRAVQRLLLHAVRRHLPGGQRPAQRRPHAEDPARAHRARRPASRAPTSPGASDARARPDQARRPARSRSTRAQPLDDGAAGAQPLRRAAERAAPHLRWHPLRGEWVTYAAYRQDRTFLPPPEYNPLAPTRDAAQPDRGAGRALGRRGVRQPLPVARPAPSARRRRRS